MQKVAQNYVKDNPTVQKSFKNANKPPLIPFYEYQRRWLKDNSRFKIGMWSRQTGKSLSSAGEISGDALEKSNTLWLLISAGEAQAKELNRYCATYLKLANVVYNNVSENSQGLTGAITKHVIELKNGSRIISLAANPDTIRGYSGNVYWDEAAINKNSEEMWRAIFPIISNGFRLIITSTPKGKQGKFYQLMSATDKLWSRHIVNIEMAVAQGLPRDLEMLKTAAGDDQIWRQEYMLEWLDEAHSWLPFDDIMACEDNSINLGDGKEMTRLNKNPTYIGIDIARRNDLWVAVLLEKIGDVLWTRELIARKNIPFAEQESIVERLVNCYNPMRIAIDQTGMGEQFTERAKHQYGAIRVEGVIFSAPRKLDMASIMKQKFQDRKIRIPAGSAEIRNDLHAIQMKPSITGAPRLVDDGTSDGHADRFWAYALAISVSETGQLRTDGYEGIGGASRGIGAGMNSAGSTITDYNRGILI